MDHRKTLACLHKMHAQVLQRTYTHRRNPAPGALSHLHTPTLLPPLAPMDTWIVRVARAMRSSHTPVSLVTRLRENQVCVEPIRGVVEQLLVAALLDHRASLLREY